MTEHISQQVLDGVFTAIACDEHKDGVSASDLYADTARAALPRATFDAALSRLCREGKVVAGPSSFGLLHYRLA